MVKVQNIRSDYRRLAADYEDHWRAFNAAVHGWVLARLYHPRNVLDLGCGTGQMLALIHDEFPSATLTGIDASPEMLARARERLPKAALIEGDIETVPLLPPFDTIFSLNVLHHLNDPQAHIGSLHRLCAENGTVFLCDYALESWPMKFAEMYWRLFHPAHHKAFKCIPLRTLLARYFTIEDKALLKPDSFWRLQIYRLRKGKAGPYN